MQSPVPGLGRSDSPTCGLNTRQNQRYC